MEEALEIMRHVRVLLDDESRWTRQIAERDDGKWTPPSTHDAVKWSLDGALQKVCDGPVYSGMYGAALQILNNYCSVLRPRYYFSVAYFDSDPRTTYEDVIDFLDEAIKREAANPGGLDGEFARRSAEDRARLGID